ncbi:MAG: NADH-quinone oxidoreductase subunit K [Candidatus Rokubacteria bacterium]|nr:NADH-quinone oxidoreductase subunit K [Candidatus Rokubacteria bacterium]
MLGLYTMMAHRNLLKKFVGMTIFQTAIILFFMLLSVKRRATLPIVPEGVAEASRFMNPLPHALMLTAIVVAVATAALALAILVRLHATYHSLEEDVIAAGPPPAPGDGRGRA